MRIEEFQNKIFSAAINQNVMLSTCRRFGKTELCARLGLDKAFLREKVLIVTWSKTQVEEIFLRIREKIGSANLVNQLKVDRLSPVPQIEFKNGGQITGFSSKSIGLKGQEIDSVIIDEAECLEEKDWDNLLPILKTSPNYFLTMTPVKYDPEKIPMVKKIWDEWECIKFTGTGHYSLKNKVFDIKKESNNYNEKEKQTELFGNWFCEW